MDMGKNKYKYRVDGKEMRFNAECFKEKCTEYRQKHEIKTADQLEKIIAKEVGISSNAVHKWYCSQNSPSGIELVISITEVLGVSDYHELLLEYESIKKEDVDKLSDRQMAAIKRVYDSCMVFLDEFNYSNGFMDYWEEFEKQGVEDIEKEIELRIASMMRKINLILDQELFDLRHCDVYDALWEYVSGALIDLYEGKITPGSRGEENQAFDDYCNAMGEINEIMSKYVWK